MTAAMTGVADALAELTLFNGLDAKTRSRLAGGATLLTAPRGHIVFRDGDPCAGLHVVVSGQIKLLLHAGNGHEKVFDVIGADASFGESALFLDQPHQIAAEAIIDSQLVLLARTALLREIAMNGDLAMRVIRVLAQRVRCRTHDIKTYVLFSGTQRVISHLLHEIPDETGVSGAVEVTLSTRKGIIASRLNLTQEHFSRILHELTSAALIEVDGQRVRIPNVGRLRACVGSQGLHATLGA